MLRRIVRVLTLLLLVGMLTFLTAAATNGIGYEFTMPELVIVLVSMVAPWLSQYFVNHVPNASLRWFIAMFLSGVVGVIGVAIAGLFRTTEWWDTLMYCMLAGQLSFHLWWKALLSKKGPVTHRSLRTVGSAART